MVINETEHSLVSLLKLKMQNPSLEAKTDLIHAKIEGWNLGHDLKGNFLNKFFQTLFLLFHNSTTSSYMLYWWQKQFIEILWKLYLWAIVPPVNHWIQFHCIYIAKKTFMVAPHHLIVNNMQISAVFIYITDVLIDSDVIGSAAKEFFDHAI